MNIVRQISYHVSELPEFWADVHADGTIGLSGVDYISYTPEEFNSLREALFRIALDIEQYDDSEQSGEDEQSEEEEQSEEDEGPVQLVFIFSDEEDDSDESL